MTSYLFDDEIPTCSDKGKNKIGRNAHCRWWRFLLLQNQLEKEEEEEKEKVQFSGILSSSQFQSLFADIMEQLLTPTTVDTSAKNCYKKRNRNKFHDSKSSRRSNNDKHSSDYHVDDDHGHDVASCISDLHYPEEYLHHPFYSSSSTHSDAWRNSCCTCLSWVCPQHQHDHLHHSQDELYSKKGDEDLQHSWLKENLLFVQKLQIMIFILGMELGILAQSSTVGVQSFATRFVLEPDISAKLILSLIWSYILAVMALMIFFTCQRSVQLFLQEVLKPYISNNNNNNEIIFHSNHKHNNINNLNNDNDNQHSINEVHVDMNDMESQQQQQQQQHRHQNVKQKEYQLILDYWKVEIQCHFVQGTVVGVFGSWLFVDMIMNYTIQVIYGGTMLLLSLCIFMLHIYCKQRQLSIDHNHRNNNDKSSSSSSSAATTIIGEHDHAV